MKLWEEETNVSNSAIIHAYFQPNLTLVSGNPVQREEEGRREAAADQEQNCQGLGIPPTLGSLPPLVSGARLTPEQAPEIHLGWPALLPGASAGRLGRVGLAGGLCRRTKGRPVLSSSSPAYRRTKFIFLFFKDKLLKVKGMKPREVKIQRQKFNVEKRPCWETAG